HTRSKRDWSSDVCSSDLCCFCIKHTETVVMLGGKEQVFKPAFLCKLCPLIRTEFDRIKCPVCIDILFLERFDICPVYISLRPGRSEERRVGKELRSARKG